MFLKSKRTSRSVDYLLAALSPLEVARATHQYLGTLSDDELQGLIARSLARMDDDERAYYEMSPDFGTFLEQNRRALRTLDRNALRAILMPVIVSRSATVEGTDDDLSSQLRAALPPVSTSEGLRRLTKTAAERSEQLRRSFFATDASLERIYRGAFSSLARAATGTALAVAIVAAGAAVTAAFIFLIVPAGKAALAWAMSYPAVVSSAPVPQRVAVHHHAIAAARAHPAPPKIVVAQRTAPPATATPAPTPRPTATPAAAPKPTATPASVVTAEPVRIAAATKPGTRDRQAALHRLSSMKLAAGTMPSREPPLVQRARLIVMSYLDSLMRGDASSALGNLGLSASAGTSNLTEAPILAGATEFRVVRAALADASSAKVQVVIDSPQGRYFGDYIVSANGPAAWITQHEVIPVESTVARHF
ncbi:MAG: hypothetical protein JO322_06555 [Candidatus Eremiobacteraeota bacterium]|nr:hypothetical protein [Candidatus Eremiobacteraeota bacterium]